jgi:hypothetical protein
MKLADVTPSTWRGADRLIYLGLAILILGPRSGLPGSEWSYEVGLLLLSVALTLRLAWEIRQREVGDLPRVATKRQYDHLSGTPVRRDQPGAGFRREFDQRQPGRTLHSRQCPPGSGVGLSDADGCSAAGQQWAPRAVGCG